jgi:peptide/nickel transport system permease protein
MILGIGLGVLAALRRGRLADRTIVGGAVVGLCTPAFVVSVLLIYLFSVEWHWFPAFGKGGDLPDQVWHLTLPALALALVSAAFVLRHTRAAVVGVLDDDYITFARARGLGAGRILAVYVLRNALIPIVTISGIMLAFLITGAVLVENTFSLPGIGDLLVQAATTKDLPMIQGITLVMAVVIMGCNLLIDVVYALVDPRVRLGGRA